MIRSSRPQLFEMTSDVEMVDADPLRFSTTVKGKGKVADPVLPEEDDALPW